MKDTRRLTRRALGKGPDSTISTDALLEIFTAQIVIEEMDDRYDEGEAEVI